MIKELCSYSINLEILKNNLKIKNWKVRRYVKKFLLND